MDSIIINTAFNICNVSLCFDKFENYMGLEISQAINANIINIGNTGNTGNTYLSINTINHYCRAQTSEYVFTVVK